MCVKCVAYIDSMESVHGKFKMEKFDGSGDFGMWKFKMLMQLELQGLGHILTA